MYSKVNCNPNLVAMEIKYQSWEISKTHALLLTFFTWEIVMWNNFERKFAWISRCLSVDLSNSKLNDQYCDAFDK